MYLWKVDHLAADLNQDKVGQKEQFKYLLVLTLLNAFLMGLIALGMSDMPQGLIATDLVITLLITAAGIVYCFYCNRQADDRDFIVRFICLGLPVTLRITVFGFLLGLLVGLIAGLTMGNGAGQGGESGFGVMNMTNMLVGYVIQVAYFVYLGRWMGRVPST